MIESRRFDNKKILLIDKAPKIKNDRTWCFWEDQSGYFEEIVFNRWDDLKFKTENKTIDLQIAPYQYKMIRGLDFYNHCFKKINSFKNIEIEYGDITIDKLNKISIDGNLLNIDGAIVFNSIYAKPKSANTFYLLQHFTGWVIETKEPVFNEATLMDFSIDQSWGTSFIYLLPFSKNKALIEYTLFTSSLLKEEEYEQALKDYIEKQKGISNYSIEEKEFGVIPMTNIKFEPFSNGIYNIGTIGGQTKGSTGYTFKFIQERADEIVSELIGKGLPSKVSGLNKRHHFYDSTLLHILTNNMVSGKEVFNHLFSKNKANKVLKFLDNKTTILEELRIINSLPKKPFAIAGLKELYKSLFR